MSGPVYRVPVTYRGTRAGAAQRVDDDVPGRVELCGAAGAVGEVLV